MQELKRSPTAQSDPDGPFCAVDLVHWTRTHAKPNLAPPATIDPTRNQCQQVASRWRTTEPTYHAASACSGSHLSSQSYHSRSGSMDRSQERERERCASRMLDVASAGSILFYMLYGCEPFPADGEEMIKSWRSKDASGITWPSCGALCSPILLHCFFLFCPSLLGKAGSLVGFCLEVLVL